MNEIDDKINKILSSEFVQRLNRLYPIKIWYQGFMIVTIELRDRANASVDLLTIGANDEGLITVEECLHNVAIAFEMGSEEKFRKDKLREMRKTQKDR